MKDFEIIRSLVGMDVTAQELENVDCYIQNKLGLFIPSMGPCGYATKNNHTHPSYMFIIRFSYNDQNTNIKIPKNHYFAQAVSPDIPHCDIIDGHYYCILIDREYFESQYILYSDQKPYFEWTSFPLCSDILKTLNTFAFEYCKNMPNSDITLNAQATVITHWIIRSILGENLDMRTVSSDYSIARAQHYIEKHFEKNITASDLADLGYMSVSSLNRAFKKETGMTPIGYLIEIRIEQAKKLLRRKNIPITEIALRCGFGSSAHFSSCFAKHTGTAPSEYRNKYID